MAKLKAFTLGSFHSPGWLTPRWDVDRRNEEVGWGRPLCVHHGDISGCELLSVGPPDSGRPLPSAETARKREAGRRLRRRKSWKRKSLQKALPRQPQGPLQRRGPPASLRLGRTEGIEGRAGEWPWALARDAHPALRTQASPSRGAARPPGTLTD